MVLNTIAQALVVCGVIFSGGNQIIDESTCTLVESKIKVENINNIVNNRTNNLIRGGNNTSVIKKEASSKEGSTIINIYQ